MNKFVSASIMSTLVFTTLNHCKSRGFNSDSDVQAVIENQDWYEKKIGISGAQNPDDMSTAALLDVRGVGDSGVDVGPMEDVPQLWRADLSFVNLESIVADSCSEQNSGVDFFFRSSLAQVRKAIGAGFNVFSVANNHARDCFVPYGPNITSQNMASFNDKILWHGVSKTDEDSNAEPLEVYTPRIKEFLIKGRKIRVAFAAIAIQSWSMNGVAQIVSSSENPNKPLITKLLTGLANADVDFRMLSVHTQDGSGNNRQEDTAVGYLKAVGERFIKDFKGNIVFGSGPHTKAGVKVVNSADGHSGVIFTSLGNFIHEGVSAHGDNILGRALFDIETKQLKTVQVMPVANGDGSVTFLSTSEASAPNSNFTWSRNTKSFFAQFNGLNTPNTRGNSCDEAKLKTCLQFNGGAPCYEKWGCKAP